MKIDRQKASQKAESQMITASLCAAMILIGIGTSAHAQNSPTSVPTAVQSTRSEISLNGEVIMRLNAEAGLSAEQRADIIRERLIPILSMENLQAEDVILRPGPDRSYASIYVRDHLLVTVTKGMAQVNKTTPEALATIYADRFRRVLPPVSSGDYKPSADAAEHGPL